MTTYKSEEEKVTYKQLDELAKQYIRTKNAVEQQNIRKQIVESGSSLAYFLCNIVPDLKGQKKEKV